MLQNTRKFFHLIKGICKTPTARLILSNEILDAFLQDQEQDKYICSCHFYSTCAGGSSQGNWARKRNKEAYITYMSVWNRSESPEINPGDYLQSVDF